MKCIFALTEIWYKIIWKKLQIVLFKTDFKY